MIEVYSECFLLGFVEWVAEFCLRYSSLPSIWRVCGFCVKWALFFMEAGVPGRFSFFLVW